MYVTYLLTVYFDDYNVNIITFKLVVNGKIFIKLALTYSTTPIKSDFLFFIR